MSSKISKLGICPFFKLVFDRERIELCAFATKALLKKKFTSVMRAVKAGFCSL